MDIYVMMLKLLLAVFLGGLIGLERERRHSAAGLRTHILVCLACTCLTLVTLDAMPGEVFKIAAGIVTGIGFLGAGTIISHGYKVRGLTTAASVWAVAIVGILTGLGYFIVGMLMTFIMLFVLHFKQVDRYFIQ